MEAAIAKRPHVPALYPEATAHLQSEVTAKEAKGAVQVVLWEDLKKKLPSQLKIPPIAMIPHKLWTYRAILDLSYILRSSPEEIIQLVNKLMTKTAPREAVDQLGHLLLRIIHVFVEADDAKVFMEKWDIKDVFLRLDCKEGKEYNSAYMLRQEEGPPTKLVILTTLQMS
jgi:hypothetical protein